MDALARTIQGRKRGKGMKIVIEIDEARFKDIRRIAEVQLERNHFQTVEQIIANGTPLPKGHGRLIDADELKTLSYEVLVDTDNPNRADGLSSYNGLVEDDIDLAPTIIEADNAESDGV